MDPQTPLLFGWMLSRISNHYTNKINKEIKLATFFISVFVANFSNGVFVANDNEISQIVTNLPPWSNKHRAKTFKLVLQCLSLFQLLWNVKKRSRAFCLWWFHRKYNHQVSQLKFFRINSKPNFKLVYDGLLEG